MPRLQAVSQYGVLVQGVMHPVNHGKGVSRGWGWSKIIIHGSPGPSLHPVGRLFIVDKQTIDMTINKLWKGVVKGDLLYYAMKGVS